ncbi:MAG TPA: hypothetical protein VIQ24_11780 [Pyrinomonadaceae bacterium]
MMRKYIWASILGAVLLGCNSCISVRFTMPASAKHDPDLAATAAILFAKEAFIDLNQPEAYDFLSDGMRRHASLEQYINMIARMHPDGFPDEVTAAEYEAAPGEDAMFIWLFRKGREESFYYRLRMEVTAEMRYKVAEVERVDKLPASQSRKPLPARRSTAGLR